MKERSNKFYHNKIKSLDLSNFLLFIVKLIELESYHFNLVVDDSEKKSTAATYTITKVNLYTPLFYYTSLQNLHYFFFFSRVLLNFASYNITHKIYIRSFSRNSRLNKLPHQPMFLDYHKIFFYSTPVLKHNFPLLLFCGKVKKISFSLFKVLNNENTYTSIISSTYK